jgi:trimeric autotransporter adhesin
MSRLQRHGNASLFFLANQAKTVQNSATMKTSIQFEAAPKLPRLLIPLLLLCIGLLPQTQAVVPPPDGFYPGFNTAEGQNALLSLDVTNGFANTAVGWFSLSSNIEGHFNTASGAGTLLFNTADENTAFGAAALLFNTIGAQNTAVGAAALLNNTTGSQNTATGDQALFSNITGSVNTAVGYHALKSNTTGDDNTATGRNALLNNTSGGSNTANGVSALFDNTTGINNTANGHSALFSNTTGGDNTATGVNALFNNTEGEFNTANGVSALASNTEGDGNTATGVSALQSNTTGFENTANGDGALFSNTTGELNTAIGFQALRDNVAGDSNTAIGDSAGLNITGSGNVCIGAGVNGFAGESDITRIRNVYQTVATERAVYVTSDNRIGTMASSRRHKEQITPMEKTSDVIHSLSPVSFRYKKEVDPARSLCFGLIAEEVAEVNPNLVTLDREGKPETVRYEAINAMLLNEFLKEHRTVQEQGNTIAELKSEIANLTATVKKQAAQIEKVTTQLEVLGPTPQIAANDY